MTAAVRAATPPGALAAPPVQAGGRAGVPAWLTLLLAAACGLVVANIYYAQPLAGPISASLGLSPQAAGLVVTMTQVGYGVGLLLVVPLADLVENLRLVLCILCVGVLALLGAALSGGPAGFLAASLLIGIGSVAVQVLVPYASHLAPDATRGRVVGNVMSGLLLGIMAARPAASFIAHATSWHAVFFLSAGLTAALAVVLRLALPRYVPAPGLRYGALLRSMGRLAMGTPILQRRAFYHACLFAGFSVFWTAAPLLLADRFHLTQNGIALFAVVGMGGAVAAPIAGRVADRGWSRPATGLAMLAAAAAFLLSLWAASGTWAGLVALAAAAVLLDCGVAANNVLGQRAIYALAAALRGRLNGLYMATFFAGGAVGSAVGGWAYAVGGWTLAASIGFALPVVALLGFLTERRGAATRRP